MLDGEKRRRHVRKPDVNAGLPRDVSHFLLLVDEDEEDKIMSCIISHTRFIEVVEKLLHIVHYEQTQFMERVEELKVCVYVSRTLTGYINAYICEYCTGC